MSAEKASGRRPISKWILIGVPVGIAVILAAVLGGVLGSRNHNNDNNNNNNGSSGSSPQQSSSSAAAAASSAASVKNQVGRFATATNTYGLPVYPTTTNTAVYSTPTFSSNAALAWPADSFKPSSPSLQTARSDRPRLIAPSSKWTALPSLVQSDPYIRGWNETIMNNATAMLQTQPKKYYEDGGSGALDIAREVKSRIKHLAYAYRVTNNSAFAERAWSELENASGNVTSFGQSGDNWNTKHFLDVGEFTAAFAIGYDWLYDYWTPQRRTDLMYSIISLGLKKGLQAYNDPNSGFGWWRTVNGNWNCVCNGGLAMGALAILGEDPTNTASQILDLVVDNSKANCARGPSSDGTWSETANYAYFGTTAHAEMAASLLTATGSSYDLLTVNPSFSLYGYYHIYVTGMTSLFNYGDHGPNKFSTTSNAMMFYGKQYNNAAFTLFQRDRIDAAEPFGLFFYDPSVSGAWWDGLPLDRYFANGTDQWASMRTSWTDNNGLYVAIKAGVNSAHQTHNDLDAGDFVLDAMGQRWAGELGSGDYISDGYFSGSTPDAPRWLYYRKRTEGQNTLVVDHQNQDLTGQPTCKFDTSNTTQGSSTVSNVPSDSTAFFTADLTASYSGTSIQRGIRLINGRKQVLLQDDISNAATSIQWRMHTNATVDISSSGTSATLTLEGKKLEVQLLNTDSLKFTTADPVRYSDDPALPSGQTDQPNPGVTVLVIEIPSGSTSVQVLFNPQWDGMSADAFKTPKAVSLGDWSLRSHD